MKVVTKMIKSKLFVYSFLKEMDLGYLHGVMETIIKANIFKTRDMAMGRYIGLTVVIIKVCGKSIIYLL